MRKLLPLIGVILLLLGIAAFGQSPSPPAEKTSALSSQPAAKAEAKTPAAPVAADSELLLIFQAHRVTSELIAEKLKAAGIPELQQELRLLQARFEAWKKAKGIPAGWTWNDQAKQFEPPAVPQPSAVPGPTGAGNPQPPAKRGS